MKRNLLLFVVMVLAVFGFSSLGLADQDPNDPGVADTLYLEFYPEDDSVSGAGPYLVRVPLYVTHDIPEANDSLAGMTIPLCYNHSNPSKYCSASVFFNDLTVYPAITFTPTKSVFRHFIEDGDTVIHNWMLNLSEKPYPYGPNKEDWDTKVLDLGDEVSHWWLAVAASGSDDRRMEEKSRILVATMTFRVEDDDTMTICVDSCFWPPSARVKLGAGTKPIYTYQPIIWDEYLGEEEVCLKVTITGVKEISGSEDSRPSEFSLSQNYPNPFNPATNFQFSLPKSAHVRVEIFNIVGQKVRTLVDEQMKAGVYLVDWDGQDEKGNFVSSGVYFYRMQAGDFSDMKKMVLVK